MVQSNAVAKWVKAWLESKKASIKAGLHQALARWLAQKVQRSLSERVQRQRKDAEVQQHGKSLADEQAR